MGKKKIVQKTEEEILKENEALKETASRQADKIATSSKKIETGDVYIHASYNNTIITVTDNKGNVITEVMVEYVVWNDVGRVFIDIADETRKQYYKPYIYKFLGNQ